MKLWQAVVKARLKGGSAEEEYERYRSYIIEKEGEESYQRY
jgi:hypothetical protein